MELDLPCEREVALVKERILEVRPEVPGLPDEWVSEFLTDGKYVRPRLLFLSYYAAGGELVEDEVVDAAASIELIHCASLVHDDILDDAETRRGLLSAPVLIGEPLSILLGDALFTEAFWLGSNLGPEVTRLTREGVRDMVVGEAREVVQDGDWGAEEARQVAREKTASLLGTACATGAVLAEADPKTVDRCRRFGVKLGVAFQAVDDVLDVTGEADETGKPTSLDARVGAPNLARALGGDGANQARRIAVNQVQEAFDLIEPLPETEGKKRMMELAEFVSSRDA